MVSTRIRSRSPIALLLGLFLVLGALCAPAEAAINRTLSLRASATVVSTGATVTFAGTLSNSPSGASLKLQIKAGTSWLDARTLTTNSAAGDYKIAVAMPTYIGTYYFRSYAAASSGRGSATSKTVSVTVLKKVSASIYASRTSVNPGQSVTFTGKVSHCAVGATVSLQRYAGSGWAKLTTTKLSSKCAYSKSVKPTAHTSYRLSVPRHGDYAPAYSYTKKITYNGPQPTPPTITTTSLPDGSTDTAYSQTLTKTGAAGTWSKTAGTFPAGIALTGSTGALTGTPTAGGTYNFTVRFTETGSGLSASKALSITVVSGPSITTTSLPDGMRGQVYAATLTKTGADGTWSALHLPTGVTLDADTGAISGTPIVEGDFTVAVTFTETVSAKQAHASFPLHIATSPPPVITSTTVPDGVKNAAYTTTLTKTGNAGTWAVTSGSLPAGFALDATTGALTGTPATSDDWPFTVTFTETAAQTKDTQAYVLHVSPSANSPEITTDSLPNATVGVAYGGASAKLEGDPIALNWTVSKFALPTGLSLSASGQISGTPTVSGDFTFQVKYTTLTGTNTKLFTIHVDPAP